MLGLAGAIVPAVALGVGAAPAPAGATPAPAGPGPSRTGRAGDPEPPTLRFGQAGSQKLYGRAYDLAIRNLTQTNTVAYDPDVYNKSGLMDAEGKFIRAGGGYPQPWTRDASINSWNAASLISPDAARNTLWSAVDKNGSGALVIDQSDQQWDQLIWIIAAWHHYLVTGDRSFLTRAYETSRNTIQIHEQGGQYSLNKKFGLFTGPSFFNDGVAGYPVPPADSGESRGSASFAYPQINQSMFLSTNCVYHGAYRDAASMAVVLHRPAAEARHYLSRAAALKAAINRNFWDSASGTYRYMVMADGKRGDYQEGTGLSLAVILGVAGPGRADSVIRHARQLDWGIPDVYPSFERYSESRPGRHNAIVWPMVQGLWAHAAAEGRNTRAYAWQAGRLARLAVKGGEYWEIYNGTSGEPDGGWQTGDHWPAQPDQAWSASAFLDMMYHGLVGLRFTADGLVLRPTLPPGWGGVTLSGLRYRDAELSVELSGAGEAVGSILLDGHPLPGALIPADLHGTHRVRVVVA